MTRVSGALALAASIAAMDQSALMSLAAQRRVAAPGSVHDPLGLALELLRSESVTRALQRLDRRSLAELSALSRNGDAGDDTGDDTSDDTARSRLRELGLVGIDNGRAVALPEVSDALEAALRGAAGGDRHPEGSRDPLSSEPSSTGTPGSAAEHAATLRTATPHAPTQQPAAQPPPASTLGVTDWYAPALAATRRTAALLAALDDSPAPLGRSGAATVFAARELAAAAAVGEADGPALLLAVAQSAGLAEPVSVLGRRGETRVLHPSASTRGWLAEPLHARWVVLANAALQGVDPAVRHAIELGSGDLATAVTAMLPHEYPLLPETDLAAARVFADTAEALGLTVAGKLAPPALALLSGDLAAARTIAERDFPQLAPGVYVQPDLSVIVPGTLTPEDEQALAEIAEAEQWDVAVSLRLSDASLRRALRSGIDTGRIRALLERLSLTGIPQPLDYLLGDLDRERAGGTTTHSAALRSAALRSAARSAAPTAPAAATLTDSASERSEAEAADDALAEMVGRVHAAATASPATGELSRILELAIRDRTPVRVIAEAGGQEHVFTLLPVAISGGRLRASDEQAGVQRTLPLSAIVAVEAAA